MLMSEKKWSKFPCSNCKYVEFDGTVDKDRCSRCRRTYKTDQGEKIREQEVELADLRYKLELMATDTQEPVNAYLTEENRHKTGRTPKITEEKDIQSIKSMIDKGISTRAIAKQFGVSKNTISNIIKKNCLL